MSSIPGFPRVVNVEWPSHSAEAAITWSDGSRDCYAASYLNALREYFTRPKGPTPRERAEALLRSQFPHLADNSVLAKRVGDLVEEAARRGVDWTEE